MLTNLSDNNRNNNNQQPPPPPSGESTNTSDTNPQDIGSSFVVFQQSDGNRGNVVYHLPHGLVPSPSENETRSEESTENTPNQRDNLRDQRNMYISVNYVYTQNPVPVSSNATDPPLAPVARTGTILLNIPDVPGNRTEAQMGQLVEFAASIALGAISAHGWASRSQGIKIETFEKFEVLKNDDIEDHSCAICFEDYLFEELVNNEKQQQEEEKEEEGSEKKLGDKRKGDDELESQGNRPSKKAKLSEGSSNSTVATGTSESNQEDEESTSRPGYSVSANRTLSNLNPLSGNTTTETSEEPEYKHTPVKLPCSHIFGRDCLYEWLKTKNSCPLCRKVVHEDHHQPNVPERLNVPNIESFMNPSTRERPMVVSFDRTTSTLSAVPSPATDPGTNNTITDRRTHFHQIDPFRSFGRLRNEEVRRELANLDNLNTDALFPSGVMSGRTRPGSADILTQNLYDQLNAGQELFANEDDEVRRVRQRILDRLSERRDQIMSRLRARDTTNNDGQPGNTATQAEVDRLNELGTITENDNNDTTSTTTSNSNSNNHPNSTGDAANSNGTTS